MGLFKRQRSAAPPRPRKFVWLRRILLAGLCLVVLVVIAGTVAGMMAYRSLAEGLPKLDDLEKYESSLVTHVYDRRGALMADFFIEKRILIELEDVPEFVRNATVAVEDARFFKHNGIDPKGLVRATMVNIRAKRVIEGASTITMQVARTLFLNRDRTLRRKLREMILALRIEQRFSKDDILKMYLNQVFYGHNAYGIEAASQIYFAKPAKELSLGEGLLIAGLTRAPNNYSPIHNPELSLERRKHVVRRMLSEGYLTPEEAQLAIDEPVQTNPNFTPVNESPYFVEHIRKYIEKQYGPDQLYKGGLQIHTTLDMHLQGVAERAVRHGVEAADKRHGYQRPFRRLTLSGDELADRQLIEQVTLPPDTDPVVREGEMLTGVVSKVSPGAVWVRVKGGRGVMIPDEGFAWVRESNLELDFDKRKRLSPEEIFQPGDVIRVRVARADEQNLAHQLVLEQEPLLQGALIAIEPASGHVLAMVGGYDEKSQYNRATQAARQPGSAFKPIIYTAALEAGKTPASVIYDRAVIKEDGDDLAWKPQNYTQKYYGATTLRTALTWSRNMVTVRLMEQVGVEPVVDLATRLGIESELGPYLSLALGSSDVKLLELTSVYGTLANGGLHVPPVFITRIVDAGQNILEENLPSASRAVSPDVAYVMTSLMQGVIKEGTGKRVRALGRPAAGKTGTTNDFRDAWFLGFTPTLVTGVWVGFDDSTALGRHESGGRVASPIWLEFMQSALKGQPVTDFPIPPGVRFYRINTENGREVRGVDESSKTRFEAFIKGTKPSPPLSPAKDIRQKIHRLDRQQNAARTFE